MNIWQKIFSKITFKDYPDVSTPLNATNLNVMTNVIDGLDDRVIESRNDIIKILGNMASEYDKTSIYDVGSYVIYNGLLYKCINAISNAEEWDSSKWEKTDCGIEFEKLNTEFVELNSNLETKQVTDFTVINNNPDRATINGVTIYKQGNLIHITIDIITVVKVNPGENIFTANIDKYKPIAAVCAHTYSTTRPIGVFIDVDGKISMRLEGTQELQAPSSIKCGFTYITN